MKIWDKNKLKRFNIWDIGLIKLAVIALTLFVITMWSGIMDWVHSVNTWIFLVAVVVTGAIPFYKFYIKRK